MRCVQQPRVLLDVPCRASALGCLAGAVLLACDRRALFSALPGARTARAAVQATFLCAAAATFWSQWAFQPSFEAGEEIVFKPIRDYFTHANVLAELSSAAPLQTIGRFGLAGERSEEHTS